MIKDSELRSSVKALVRAEVRFLWRIRSRKSAGRRCWRPWSAWMSAVSCWGRPWAMAGRS